MKMGREEMVALYAAIQQYMRHDEQARLEWCEREVQMLVDQLRTARHFSAIRTWPNQAGQPLPRAFVSIDDHAISPSELRALLMEGNPGIICYSENRNGVYVNPMCLAEGQMQIIGDRFLEIDRMIGG